MKRSVLSYVFTFWMVLLIMAPKAVADETLKSKCSAVAAKIKGLFSKSKKPVEEVASNPIPQTLKTESSAFDTFTNGVDQARFKLGDPSRDVQAKAIASLGEAKIDLQAISHLPPGQVNKVLLAPLDELHEFIRVSKDPELQIKAFEAVSAYARANAGNYRLGSLGMFAYEDLAGLVENGRLPDTLRKRAYDELVFAKEQLGLGQPKPFRTGAELKAEADASKAAWEASKAAEARNFERANAETIKEIGEAEKANGYAKANGYGEISHVDFQGMTHLPGLKANTGLDVLTEYTPSGGGKLILKGTIEREYQAGFTLRDASGHLHEINVNHGKIGPTYARNPAARPVTKLADAVVSQPRPANGYVSIKHIDFQGMEIPRGSRSILGDRAVARFTDEKGVTKEISGRIARVYQAGFDMVDSEGRVHAINVNFGKIDSVLVKPENLNWQSARNYEDFARATAGKGDLFITATLPTEDKGFMSQTATISGRLKQEKVNGQIRYSITDASGTVHVFDEAKLKDRNVMFDANITEYRPELAKDLGTRRKDAVRLVSDPVGSPTVSGGKSLIDPAGHSVQGQTKLANRMIEKGNFAESEIRDFDVSDILSVSTGKLVSNRHMDGVYDVMNFLNQNSNSTIGIMTQADSAKKWLVKQYPELASIDSTGVKDTASLNKWLDEKVYPKYGKTLRIVRYPPADLADLEAAARRGFEEIFGRASRGETGGYGSKSADHLKPLKEPAHSILGISENATRSDAEAAFRDLAKRFHPDVNSGPGALEKMQEVNSAYAEFMRKFK